MGKHGAFYVGASERKQNDEVRKMLTAEQLEQFNQSGIVRIPRAITKSAADGRLGTVWDCLRERYHIHRDSLDTWPEPEIRPAMQISGAHRFTGTHHLPKSVTF